MSKPFNALTGHHKRVAKFFATCAAENQSLLNITRGQHEREARGVQVHQDVDNLVPGGLPAVGIGDSYYETMLHEWLKVLISDHQR